MAGEYLAGRFIFLPSSVSAALTGGTSVLKQGSVAARNKNHAAVDRVQVKSEQKSVKLINQLIN